ncbi:HlyD family efflux transporter periplasmic adaptor subunit [Olivibacter sp. CPCC 100613]|uniref:HlyD family secretion protein n=1 Tax=Olivibacter sp. CPCC 100613 TaxID=3079931 RepID=UPI002FF44389
MDDKVLPVADPEILEITYLQKIKVSSQIIYVLLLTVAFTALALLPFIYVDVSVKSTGMLQTPMERSEILVPINGKLDYFNLSEYQKVKKGDTLLRIDSRNLTDQNFLINNRIRELELLLQDVETLGSVDVTAKQQPKLKAPKYVAAWQQSRKQLTNALISKTQTQRAFDRFNRLHERKVVSDAEYEEHLMKRDQAAGEYDYIASQYKTQWQSDADTYRTELSGLYRDRSNTKSQEIFYTVLAPVDGSVQNLIGIQLGAPVFANQKIAELSPDSSLIAMMFVKPSDIGLIQKGQSIRFQIDAFNYNQWGILRGKVLNIGEDMVLDGNKNPVFKVMCELDKDHLKLPNGYIGKLKKGMTLQGRFIVNRRSLYQLLYDKIDDWINPNLIAANSSGEGK